MLAVATMFGQVIVRTKLPQALVTLTPPYGMTTKKFKQSESRKNIPRGVCLKRQMLRGISYFSFGLHLLRG